MAGVIMMVEQSLTLVLVMVWLFVRMLTRSEQEELRRERLEDAQVAAAELTAALAATAARRLATGYLKGPRS